MNKFQCSAVRKYFGLFWEEGAKLTSLGSIIVWPEDGGKFEISQNLCCRKTHYETVQLLKYDT